MVSVSLLGKMNAGRCKTTEEIDDFVLGSVDKVHNVFYSIIRESIRRNTDYGNHIVPGMWEGNLVSRRKVPVLRKTHEAA